MNFIQYVNINIFVPGDQHQKDPTATARQDGCFFCLLVQTMQTELCAECCPSGHELTRLRFSDIVFT
jgi:hypothetical protein